MIIVFSDNFYPCHQHCNRTLSHRHHGLNFSSLFALRLCELHKIFERLLVLENLCKILPPQERLNSKPKQPSQFFIISPLLIKLKITRLCAWLEFDNLRQLFSLHLVLRSKSQICRYRWLGGSSLIILFHRYSIQLLYFQAA